MARNVRLSALGPRAMTAEPGTPLNQLVSRAKERVDHWIGKVLPENPDFIVLHEVFDVFEGLDRVEKRDYYIERGLTIQEHVQQIAKREGVNIAYSAVIPAADGILRNRTSFIGRDGEVRGFYNKNHLVWEENSEQGCLFGKDAPLTKMDFGTVGGVICFDLNFDELRMKYVRSRPELLAFCSMYHGGFVQQNWAYTCRSWLVSAVCNLPCAVINPVGEIVAQSTNYFPYVNHTVNLDYAVAHLDYNWDKLDAMRAKYRTGVTVRDPGLLGSVLITSECDVPVSEMIREFEIELLDDYMARSIAHRHAPGKMEE